MTAPVRWYDCVVVGGGPGGVFAAHALAAAGADVMLVEAGDAMRQSLCPRIQVDLDGRLVRASERFRMQCPRCTCLTGLGGAAFHFDTNLGYPTNLSRSKIEADGDRVRSFSTLERALQSFERAESAVHEVFETMYRFGLPTAGDARASARAAAPADVDTLFAAADLNESQSITVDVALTLVEGMMADFSAAGGELVLRTRVTRVRRIGPAQFRVTLTAASGAVTEVAARTVVVAVGKLGLSWVRTLVEELGLSAQASDRVDLGVRVEGSAAQLQPFCSQCSNPKLAFINQRGESVRTFCVCSGGRIMQYVLEDAVVLDGQHCLTRPTKRSNFGIVTTVRVPDGMDGTDYALGVARSVTARGNGRPVACTVGELRAHRSGEPSSARRLDTSLIDVQHAALGECLPAHLVADVLEMADRLNAVFPGVVSEDAVVAAPVVERLYPRVELSPNLESSEPGLYFVGDASGKIIGVTYGAATGLVAARHVLASAALDGRDADDVR